MNYNMASKIMALIFILCLAGYIYIIASQYHDCNKNNGDFVRGLFWFECLNKEDK